MRLNILQIGPDGQVALVEHGDPVLALGPLGEQAVVRVQGPAAVEYAQHERRGAGRVQTARHADLFRFRPRPAQAGRVLQNQLHAARAHLPLHNIARGAGRAGDNAVFAAGEQVHQRGLARVRPARNDGAHAVPYNPARVIAAQQLPRLFLNPAQLRLQLRRAGLLYLVVRKIHIRRNCRGNGEQAVAQGLDLTGRAPLQVRARGRGFAAAVRLDQLHDRLCLRQVQLSVYKGAAGELARLRHAHAQPAQRAQRQPEHGGRAVAGKLHHVLACIGAGRGKGGEHACVEHAAVRAAQFAVHGLPVPDPLRFGKERPGRRKRVRAADPYYAHRRRLHGRDGRAYRVAFLLHFLLPAFSGPRSGRVPFRSARSPAPADTPRRKPRARLHGPFRARRPAGLAHRHVFGRGLYIRRLELEYDGPQPIVAATNRNARFADPVPVIEQLPARAVRQGEHILINRLPRLVAQPVGPGVIGVKDLTLPQHEAGRQPLRAVLGGQLSVQRGF